MMTRKLFEQQIADFIERERLFVKEQKLLAAVSGGADSVALLLVLEKLGYKLEAVHCNFHLRGDESERDAAFCQRLCEHENIPFHRKDFDTRAYAKTKKVSIEMAARELRYTYFEQLRQTIGAAFICVAHHCEDQAETVLLNLLRGTGLKGLRGMLPSQGHVVRPLLDVSRSDIECYLELFGQHYVTDSTNLLPNYARNKLRLQILPLLRSMNPRAVENICRTTKNVRMAELMLGSSGIAGLESSDGISIEALKQFPSPAYVLFEYLGKRGFSSAQIEQISKSLEGESGRRWLSSTHELLIDRGRLLVQERSEEPVFQSVKIPQVGVYQLLENQQLTIAVRQRASTFLPSRDPLSVDMDASCLSFPLLLRHVAPGDRISLRSGGSKTVSDLLCDNKKSLFEKRSQLVLADASGVVLWVVGLRLSAHVYVTADTQSIISARLRSSGVSMPMVSTSVNPTRIL